MDEHRRTGEEAMEFVFWLYEKMQKGAPNADNTDR